MIKGGFLSESLMQFKKIFQILIQIKDDLYTCIENTFSNSENLNLLPKTVDNLVKFSAQDGDLKFFFEPLQTF